MTSPQHLQLAAVEANVFSSDIRESLYIWETDGQALYYDNQETVRFRIEDEIWHDQIPSGPREKDDAGTVKSSPYQLIATMEDAGVGPCLWWDGEREAEEEEV